MANIQARRGVVKVARNRVTQAVRRGPILQTVDALRLMREISMRDVPERFAADVRPGVGAG